MSDSNTLKQKLFLDTRNTTTKKRLKFTSTEDCPSSPYQPLDTEFDVSPNNIHHCVLDLTGAECACPPYEPTDAEIKAFLLDVPGGDDYVLPRELSDAEFDASFKETSPKRSGCTLDITEDYVCSNAEVEKGHPRIPPAVTKHSFKAKETGDAKFQCIRTKILSKGNPEIKTTLIKSIDSFREEMINEGKYIKTLKEFDIWLEEFDILLEVINDFFIYLLPKLIEII